MVDSLAIGHAVSNRTLPFYFPLFSFAQRNGLLPAAILNDCRTGVFGNYGNCLQGAIVPRQRHIKTSTGTKTVNRTGRPGSRQGWQQLNAAGI